MRDDFPASAKELLAKRVGFQCCNPECRKRTSGPQEDPSGTINIGVAAHIAAASPTGPRYDSSQSPKERGSPENGIWLCQNCAKLIDSDVERFGADRLREWKSEAEAEAALALESRRAPVSASEGVFPEAARLTKAELDLASVEAERRHSFVERQLRELYSPLLGITSEIRELGVSRLKVRASTDQAWR